MPDYVYTAIDNAGKKHNGGLRAPNEAAALKEVETLGLIPLTLDIGQVRLPWWAREFSLSQNSKSLSDNVLLEFFTTLSRLLTANLKLSKALLFCEKHSKKPSMRMVISKILNAVENGDTIAQAMSDQAPLFPKEIITMVRIGEETNTLSETMKRISRQLERQVELRSEIQSALLYPLILICMSVLVLGMVVFFLVPTLLPIFASTGEAPPAFLGMMDWLRQTIIDDWKIVLLGIVLFGFVALKAVQHFRYQLFDFFTRMPLIGRFLIQKGSRNFCSTLSLLLSNNVSITTALKSLNESTSNQSYKRLISEIHSDVAAGRKLTTCLSSSPLIDDIAKSFIEAGEEGNHLAEALESAASLLDKSLQETLNRAVKLLTPLLTLAIGLFIGFIVYSTISTILDINNVAF